MAIVHARSPSTGTDVLLAALASASAAPWHALVHVSEPHRCYSVGLDDIAQGRLLGAARPGSFRYLIFLAGEAVADARVADDGAGGVRLAGLHLGPMAASTVHALHRAERVETVERHDYELRCLQAPGLNFVGLWLHRDGDDLLLPTAPTPARVAPEGTYTEAQLIAQLQAPAATRKAMFAGRGARGSAGERRGGAGGA